jgi:hypothetical protein
MSKRESRDMLQSLRKTTESKKLYLLIGLQKWNH